MNHKPLYIHDCNCCMFHGTVKNAAGNFVDLYTCKGSVAVVRYGSEGPEYSSMPLQMVKSAGVKLAHTMLYVVLVLHEQNQCD